MIAACWKFLGSGLISALCAGNQLAAYTYNADGQRVRRNVAGQTEVWQLYGIDGELLAEYAATAAPASPQKEYGYRNGQLLITASCPLPAAKLPAGSATASSYYTTGYEPAKAIDANNTTTMWNAGAFPAAPCSDSRSQSITNSTDGWLSVSRQRTGGKLATTFRCGSRRKRCELGVAGVRTVTASEGRCRCKRRQRPSLVRPISTLLPKGSSANQANPLARKLERQGYLIGRHPT